MGSLQRRTNTKGQEHKANPECIISIFVREGPRACVKDGIAKREENAYTDTLVTGRNHGCGSIPEAKRIMRLVLIFKT